MGTPIIEVRNLKKIYRPQLIEKGVEVPEVHALDGVNLTIERGDFVSIMGPSGSGKSTLMQILGLLDKKSSGEYFLDGTEISTLNDDELADLRSHKIGFIFQFFNLLPRTRSVDNVALPMLYAGIPDPGKRAAELLRNVGLGDRLNHKPHQLSGGQQQRVAIARSLANFPQLVFADEPTGNISTEQSAEILDYLTKLNESGVTIILVTHEPDIANRARRQITLRDGKIASDVRTHPLPSIQAPKDKMSAAVPSQSPFSWRRIKENLKMAVVALSLNKLRTALATLGIVIGISSVVAMVAIGTGAQKSIEQQLSSLGTNLLTIYAVNPRSSPNMASGRNLRRFTVQDYEDLKHLVTATGPIDDVGGIVYGNAQVSYGANNASTRIIGATPSYQTMQNAALTVGRFFSEEEERTRQRVAVAGQTVVKNLYGENANPLGSFLKINRVEYMVIGVLESKGASAFRDADDQVIVPLSTGMYRILGRQDVDNLSVSVRSEKDIDTVTEMLRQRMRDRRKLPAGDPDDFDIRSLNDIREALNKSTEAMSILLASIASISLIVGGIGIMNVMLVSVKERTREIGLRKALGAKKQDILSQFLVESVTICLFGGGIGIFLGYAISILVSKTFGWSMIIPVEAVFLAFFFSLFVGLVFGLWPAKQASELSPIEALRYE